MAAGADMTNWSRMAHHFVISTKVGTRAGVMISYAEV